MLFKIKKQLTYNHHAEIFFTSHLSYKVNIYCKVNVWPNDCQSIITLKINRD